MGRKVERKEKSKPALVALAVLVASVAIIGGVELLNRVQTSEPDRIVEVRSNDPVLEGKVVDIASKFICSCGSCGEKPLEVCQCSTGIQERQFIRDALRGGEDPEVVVLAVNGSFGWMKPAFAKKYGVETQAGAPSAFEKLGGRRDS